MDINYYKQYEPIFGSWYITEKIGEGAYGQVYIIERHELGVVYKSALKALTIPSDRNEIKSIMSDGMVCSLSSRQMKKVKFALRLNVEEHFLCRVLIILIVLF